MFDSLYRPEEVDQDLRPIFDQLAQEFGAKYQVWRRVENFGRFVSAAVLSPSSQAAVIIPLRTGLRSRTSLLTPSEIRRIGEHLWSNSTNDLQL